MKINFNNFDECVGAYKALNEFTKRLLGCVDVGCIIDELEMIETRQQLAIEILQQEKEYLTKIKEEWEEFSKNDD